MADTGERARNMPNPVETPLPPLNLKKGEYICPKRRERERIIRKILWYCMGIFMPMVRGKKPFNISSMRVTNPHLIPISRATFAAPILPLPLRVMSTLAAKRPIISPKGMAPMKKDNKIISTNRIDILFPGIV